MKYIPLLYQTYRYLSIRYINTATTQVITAVQLFMFQLKYITAVPYLRQTSLYKTTLISERRRTLLKDDSANRISCHTLLPVY